MGGYGSDYSYDNSDDVVKKSASAYNIDNKRDFDKKEIKTYLPPPKGKVLITKARFPLVVALDVTGSMREYPKMIFEKLCILYNEALFFLPPEIKDSFEISFCAIGDAYTDNYPIQVTDFAKGSELDTNIKMLYGEGGGGGQARETYELMAYYYTAHCKMPKASGNPRPMFVFIGDEGYYGRVNRSQIQNLIGDSPETDLISTEIFDELKAKFDVYMLRIPYEDPPQEQQIMKLWVDALGKDRVIMLPDPKRVVDTILGLIAANVDKFDAFKERIEIRQTPEQVDQVFTTLNGLRMENRSYMYKFQVLKCPACGGALKEAPEFNKPVNCPYCKVLLVRI